MKERPILFKAEMVRAILTGTKTQTRRVIKPQPDERCTEAFQGEDKVWRFSYPTPMGPVSYSDWDLRCPYGVAGDRLWVKETWRTVAGADDIPPRNLMNVEAYTHYEADGHSPAGMGKLRPSIFMPRWASRLTLDITRVRLERLQAINEADAKAEGVERTIMGDGWRRYAEPAMELAGVPPCETPTQSYRALWETINGRGSWAANPWVWVVEFKQVPQ